MIKEIVKVATEVGKEIAENTIAKSFNPDKRIDIKERIAKGENEKKYNPDKRIESPKKEIENLFDRYRNELKKYSEVTPTLKQMDVKLSDFKRLSPEDVTQRRKEYYQSRADLIKQWEAKNGREWPTYKKDLINENGTVERVKGQRYDLHHVQPLSLNGKNEVSNITPLRADDHRMIHASGGSLDKLTAKVEEIQK